MWSLKVLTGPQAGQTFQLSEGSYVFGRSAQCDFPIQSKGISKEHCQITVSNGGEVVTIQDLNSANGTFVNGLRIRQQILKPGGKVGLFDVLVSVQSGSISPAIPRGPAQIPSIVGNLAHHMDQHPPITAPNTLMESIQHYVDNVALPGVYKLAQGTEYRWAIGTFLFVFALLVTGFSLIPTVELTKASIEKEGQRRALTIANSLADRYKRALQDGTSSAFSTRSAEVEEGVQVALIISAQDGHVIAPANKMGAYEDAPFIHKARKQDQKFVDQVDDTTIGASVPISTFKSEADGYSPTAYAVVLYSIEAFSMNDGRLISLLVRILMLSLVFGGLIFFLLYRVIEHPIRDLNVKVDHAIRERKDHIDTPYDYEILKKLILNINTLLGRAASGSQQGERQSVFQDRQSEAVNLVQIISNPAIAISGKNQVLHLNALFENLSGMRLATLQNQSLETITDQALQLSLKDLLERSRQAPHLIATNDLDMGGQLYEIDVQAVYGATDIEYFILTFNPKGGVA